MSMSQMSALSKEEQAHYNRHIIIPEFGRQAQEKLKSSRVLVVGAGGLGSPLLLYLAAAGVGTIGIVDCDIVDRSNLHRQVLYSTDDVGVSKVVAAKKRLESLNPYIQINTYQMQLTSANALEIVNDYDVVADGTDNFPTRYLVNDACVLADKINVYASIYQFEGQVSVFNYLHEDGTRGPNYRDLFPQPPLAGTVANCAEAGVLGVLPGIIGSIQGLEVIKVLAGIGDVLSGRLFTFDTLSFQTRYFKIAKTSGNPLSGKNPVIRKLIDYEQFCGVQAVEKPVKEFSMDELNDTDQDTIQIIDVREPFEYEEMNIGGELIPLATIEDRFDRISKDKKVVFVCKSGMRSLKAIRLLEDKYGCRNLYNLTGGLMAYTSE